MIGPTPCLAIVRMRRTAKTVIRLAGPILDIVSRMKTRTAEIRDLVMLVTRVSRLLEHPLVHHAGKIVVRLGLNAASNMFRERRTRMDLEQIKRQMLRTKLECLLDISLPAVECLTGQTCDQIEAYIRKP